MTAAERAICTSHLMYEPHREQLKPEPKSMTAEQFASEMQFMNERKQWIANAEEWMERESIRRASLNDERNRRVWGKIP